MHADPKNLQVDISICITAHKEGYLLYRTLKSIEVQCRYAKMHASPVIEILINLDNSNAETRDIAKDWANKRVRIKVFGNNFGDTALSRNFLIDKSSGTFIFIHDGDDLFSKNFLADAYSKALKATKPGIYTPQFVIPFNGDDPITNVIKNTSTTSHQFYKTSLFAFNAFTSENLVHRSIYESIKYETNEGVYGHEDYHWNTKVMAGGYDFNVVNGTMLFYRHKHESRSLRLINEAKNPCLRKTELFEPNNFLALRYVPTELRDQVNQSLPIQVTNAEQILTSSSSESEKVRLAFKIRTIAQDLLNPTSRSYYFLAHQYRAIQQLIAPIIYRIRANNNIRNFLRHQISAYRSIFARKSTNSLKKEPVKSIKRITHLNRLRLKRLGLGSALFDLWNELNQLDHNLIYAADTINRLVVVPNNISSQMEDAYYNFCSAFYKKKITDIFIVPHLTTGGADNAMIHLARSLCDEGRTVLFMTTDITHSPAKAKLDNIEGAYFWEMQTELANLSDDQKLIFLYRILQHWDVKTLTLMNSLFGYKMVVAYGEMIATHCDIYVHNYAQPKSVMGLIIDWFPLGDVYPFVKCIITDSLTHKRQLMSYYGWKNKIEVLPLPVDHDVLHEKSNGISKRVLIFSRLAAEKRISLALEVGTRLKNYGIKMDFYGTKDKEYCNSINFDENVEKNNNMKFKGQLRGFGEININRYDLLLITSSHEGIPIILLDALKANLFVVSSDVGGVNEVILNGVNGFLLSVNADAEEYVKQITQYYNDNDLQDLRKRKKINEMILAEHTVENYKTNFKNIYNIQSKNYQYDLPGNKTSPILSQS